MYWIIWPHDLAVLVSTGIRICFINILLHLSKITRYAHTTVEQAVFSMYPAVRVGSVTSHINSTWPSRDMCFLRVRQLADVRWRHTATVSRGHVICVYCWSMSVTWLYKWAEFLSWQVEVERNSSGGSTWESELELEVTVTVSDRVLSS
jgi:hypothetical protein